MPRNEVVREEAVLRIHFRARPWDLYAAVSYSLGIGAALFVSAIGNLAAILVVLFVPGYLLTAAIYPSSNRGGEREIDWIQRLGLSFGLSIAIVPLLVLLLNFTPFGIHFRPVLSSIEAFTIMLGYIAYRRRMRLPPELRLSATLDLVFPAWSKFGMINRILTIAIVASIIVSVTTIIYSALAPRATERFTEFYILGPSNTATGYPTDLNVSQPTSLVLGVANHESATTNYTIRIDLVGVRIVYNATSGLNETVEVNRTASSMFNVTLVDEQKWTQPYTLRINHTGVWKVQFVLFMNGDFSEAYHELHLYVRVQ